MDGTGEWLDDVGSMGDSFICHVCTRGGWSEVLIDLVVTLNQFHISGEKESWRE
jgi:hypothetical protein